ncbi:type I CRISPR-associated protein Cas7 [Clostridium saccharobutylicum]|uniref:Uncharacterized protein n=1 Tax=Clostridium saccharobutylicum DSM 13864 TaxID=1345695 RepID=U5MTK4_CLOSA|nr:type I CRISPR-associated protein Cas7 [Clostridium saccharobutylicum]AGX42976.1 hypothetical protein CLSA_c19920 [Clostridium saccharobutylicum DSM 13864]AQR90269.1 hypothetical protein CLOSC_19840 [Clostridium saccharobutylicum]AQS00175.1 hypothetical protein CSACC_19910 [Clostridium saccharobutylicum]AQS09974.1 hypothetical protein CLOBY_21130 [Clostridium saccharobutylicum]AQS14158.1 hypothetical protein CLOSACC_19910 [Clostridium saccharobutylicum]
MSNNIKNKLERVYGVLGIKSTMANWNADFTGYPKSLGDGTVYGSDKAYKYPMKVMWDSDPIKRVMYIKSYKVLEKGNDKLLQPRSLKERYEEIYGIEDLKKENDNITVLKNLFQAIDVKNFGATFAESGNNLSIIGAVQITQGLNKYDGHVADYEQILSPFRDGSEKPLKKGEEAKEVMQSTLGNKIFSNEAHYFYSFSINPSVYDKFVKLGVTDGYTREDYEEFKKTALIAASAYDTNAKSGCENEFGLFVETDGDLFLSDLAQYVTFSKSQEGKEVINLVELSKLLNDCMDRIQSVEIYYNPYTTVLEGDIAKARYINIFTRKDV